MSASPSNTHVIAVGISSYDIGDSWQLPAASEHAVRFVEFARAAGVPAKQIHLFLSQRDIQLFDKRLSLVSVRAMSATYSSFNDFIEKQMLDYSGDLLYFYWSGHGSISDNSQRILFYEDLSRDSQRHLDLNHFLVRLRSAPLGKFPTQIAYVDACANRFEDLGFRASPGKDQPGMRNLVSGVQQVFFLAADSGQQAVAGDFSLHVLNALQSTWQQKREWPPRPDSIIRDVRHHFRGLEQRPVQIAWRTSSGDESGIEVTSGDLPAYDFINAAAMHAGYSVRSLRHLASIALRYERLAGDRSEEQRDQLYTLLAADSGRQTTKRKTRSNAELDLLHIVASAFFWGGEELLDREINKIEPEAAEFSAELSRFRLVRGIRSKIVKLPTTIDDLRDLYQATIRTLSDEPARVDAGTIDEMLDELSQVDRGPEQFSFLFEFAIRVGTRYPREAGELQVLVRENTNQLLLATIERKLAREQRFLLSVSIDPASGEQSLPSAVEAKMFIAETAIVVNTFPKVPANTWDQVKVAVQDIVRNSRRIVIQQYDRDEVDLEIEFLLSDAFFFEAPDEIIIALNSLNKPPLGKLHPVVIRWRERLLNPSDFELTPWREAAANVDRKKPSVVHWFDKSQCDDPISACANCRGLVALRFLPKEELYNVIGAGFPFVAWLRSEPLNGTLEQFVDQFGHWAGEHIFETLPQQIRSIRQRRTDLGAALTLFWDDPTHYRHWIRSEVLTKGGL